MPDGSALVVMDKWGNLALLDVHGTVHRLQQVASPAQQHQQVPPHTHVLACSHQPIPPLLLQPANMLLLTSCWERYDSTCTCSH